MKLGIVKWFNNAKGYGFVMPDEGGEDLFVHFSYIEMDGYKTLKAGQKVSFEMTPVGKGIHATNIKRHTSATAPSENEALSNTEALSDTEVLSNTEALSENEALNDNETAESKSLTKPEEK